MNAGGGAEIAATGDVYEPRDSLDEITAWAGSLGGDDNARSR